jgi:hypothetical protein
LNLHYPFQYDKTRVIQGLRYHFVTRPEIRIILLLVNVFAIVAAILFYMKKVRPEPFLLGSLLWLGMMSAFWYFLPNMIYKKSKTFKDSFIAHFLENKLRLESEQGYADWEWTKFKKFFESPNFFHLYFDDKSFLLLPKEEMDDPLRHEVRGIFNKKIGRK